MSIESTIMEMAKEARAASMEIARCPSSKKNEVLLKIADNIEAQATYIQEENRRTIDDYKRWAEVANRLGEVCRRNGIRAAYHNHDFELQAIGGEMPFEVLLEETDPNLLDFEVDFFWVRAAGWNVRDVLALAPERMALAHIKDMDVAGNMVDVGDGTIDFAGILADPVAGSIRHCFVEHDTPPDAFRSVAASHYVLNSILD